MPVLARIVLLSAVLRTQLLVLLMWAPLSALAQTALPQAQAAGEQLQGVHHNGVIVFRGIPFAQPPVGDLRWQAPKPTAPRSGLQIADTFKPACMQTSYNTDWYVDIIKAFDGDVAQAVRPDGIEEDCLYLNVFTPQLDPARALPVMVYIYGGNNLGGWSYEPNYLGHGLAAKGVVVVSIAYRLGVFGFFAHPELTLESEHNSSGNYGLLDQLAALEWVQENIAAFGGDPGKVTVFGESAGGSNISHLMLSPLSKGLFQNAIRQSGAFEINYRDTLAREEQFGVGFADQLDATSVSQLRQRSAKDVLQAAEDYYYADSGNAEKHYFYGNYDAYVLPGYALDLYRAGKINPVNVLLGANADESLMYAPAEVSSGQIDEFIEHYFLPGSAAAVRQLIAGEPDNRHRLARLRAAHGQLCPAQLEADYMSQHNIGGVYLYHFTKVRPGIGGERLGAYHGAELPYVFDTADPWLSSDERDVALTQAIMNYWVNFAHGGNPNGSGLVNWPRYNASSRIALELGSSIRMMAAPERDLCERLKPPQP